MSQSTNALSERQRQIYKLFYQGGLQRHVPKDEAQIYVNNLFLDSLRFCVRDFNSAEPSREERQCVTNYLTKNYQLLNGNLENLI